MIVENRPDEWMTWQNIKNNYMNLLETFYSMKNPGKEQWGLDLFLCSPARPTHLYFFGL